MTPALMYHDVVPAGAEDTSGFPGRDAALYKVTPELFDAHLEAIRHLFFTGAGAPPPARPDADASPRISMSSARCGRRRSSSDLPTITFDDGGASAMTAADALARHAFGLTLLGRFTIQRWTTADTAAALAAGEWLPRARQAVVWNAKKISKRLGGERYLQLRKLLLGHGTEVQWGDQR